MFKTPEDRQVKRLFFLGLYLVCAIDSNVWAANVPFGGLCEPDQYYSCGQTGGDSPSFEFWFIILVGWILIKKFFVDPWKEKKKATKNNQTRIVSAKPRAQSSIPQPTRGHGSYTFSDGAKYIGDWKDEKMHSQGTFTSPERRNDPCPCGSGKKYKQCHGKL